MSRDRTGEVIFLVKDETADWFDLIMRRGDRTYWILPNPDSGEVIAEVVLNYFDLK